MQVIAEKGKLTNEVPLETLMSKLQTLWVHCNTVFIISTVVCSLHLHPFTFPRGL